MKSQKVEKETKKNMIVRNSCLGEDLDFSNKSTFPLTCHWNQLRMVNNNKKQSTGNKFQYLWFLFKRYCFEDYRKKANKIIFKSQVTLYTNLLYFLAAVMFFSSFYLHKLASSLAKSLLMALQHLRDKNENFRFMLFVYLRNAT